MLYLLNFRDRNEQELLKAPVLFSKISVFSVKLFKYRVSALSPYNCHSVICIRNLCKRKNAHCYRMIFSIQSIFMEDEVESSS